MLGAGVADQPQRTRVGPYTVIATLGSGGMGIVYRCRTAEGTEVAVKTIHAHLVDASARERFAREASIRIEHPNVIRVLDAGRDPDGTPFIVFELLDGETLEEALLRSIRVPPERLAAVGASACDGLAAIHAAGVVHRDVKPANLFVTRAGAVKVLDFGISRLTRGPRVTTEGSVLGTPAYLSPEQARGDGEIDAHADVWAMGVVLYEGLTGVLPFERASPLATMLAIIQDDPPQIRLDPSDAGLSAGIARAVRRCLEKDPDKRYESATVLGAELRRLASGAADTVAAAAERPREAVPSIPPGEQRILVVLLARGVLGDVRGTIEAHGGAAVPLAGETVIGLFGSAGWRGDEMRRAVSAAVECREHAERISVGSGRAYESGGSVSGEAVRAAESGCDAALAGVALDRETAAAVERWFRVRIVTDDLAEVIAERSPAHLALADSDTPLTGRDRERIELFGTIERALTAARPRCSVVAVTGSRGIGKTRMLEMVYRELAPRTDIAVSFVRAEERDSGVLAFFRELLWHRAIEGARCRGWPRLDAAAPPFERRHAVMELARDALGEESAGAAAPFLGELVGVDMGPSPALREAREDPGLMSDRLRMAARDWLYGHLERRRLVIVADDAHAVDHVSATLLADAASHEHVGAFAFVCSIRANATLPDPLATVPAVTIELLSLTPDNATALATHLAENQLSPATLREVVDRTEGNPCFIEHTVRLMRARQLLTVPAARASVLPLTVEAAMQERLDHLAREDRDLCRCASVFGRPFRLAELEALGVDRVRERVSSLAAGGILRSVAGEHDSGLGRVELTSALLGEAAYRMLTPDLRVDLHRLAATHLAAAFECQPEEVASHWERAGDVASASSGYARAADLAARRGDSLAVLRFATRALELGPPAQARFDLHLARADAYRFTGERQARASELEAALAVADESSKRARVLIEQAALLTRMGRIDDAIHVAGEAAAAAGDAGATELEAHALGRKAEALIHGTRFDEADLLLRAAAARAQPGPSLLQVLIGAWRARSLALRGDIGAALEAYTRVVGICREIGDLRRAAANEAWLADLYNRIGAYEAAERALRDALSACQKVGHRVAEGYVHANLGYALARSGRAASALDAVAAADRLARETSDARLGVMSAVYRAWALLGLGRAEEASVAVRAAAAAADIAREPGYAAVARALEAKARLALGDVAGALATSEAALSIRDQLAGIEEDEGEVFLARVAALEAAGRAAEAEEVRDRARSRLQYVARRIRDEQWRRRFLKSVPSHRALFSEAIIGPR